MKKIKLTKEEIEKTWTALNFYVNEVTHCPEKMNGNAGLPEGKERKILEGVIEKLK